MAGSFVVREELVVSRYLVGYEAGQIGRRKTLLPALSQTLQQAIGGELETQTVARIFFGGHAWQNPTWAAAVGHPTAWSGSEGLAGASASLKAACCIQPVNKAVRNQRVIHCQHPPPLTLSITICTGLITAI